MRLEVQRYVSLDLTHFVGRREKTLARRYRLLRKILREGRLRAAKPRGRLGDAAVLVIDTSARLSTNKAYSGSAVCFCDIPVCDLGLHMQKYSEFGLAFTKDFLLEAGAMPVMYVPTKARPALLPFWPYPRGRVSTAAAAFDEFWKRYRKLGQAARAYQGRKAPRGELRELVDNVSAVMWFLDVHVLSHLIFFDPHTDDLDRTNLYMEREWRVNRDVEFSLDDVRRVVLPQTHGERFRRDFPDYSGEVMFTE